MLGTNLPPHSTSKLKLAAEQNIQHKITVLEAWLKDGFPWQQSGSPKAAEQYAERIFEFVPSSLRSFNKWDSQSYPSDIQAFFGNTVFHGNGTDTLNKHCELKERVINLLEAVAQVANANQQGKQINTVKTLELEIERLNLFIQNQARKVTELHRTNLKLSKSVFAIERREKSNFEELQRNYFDLEKQNNAFREQISLLTKQLKNIHLIKSDKNVK